MSMQTVEPTEAESKPRYHSVNGAWPETMPIPTAQEAVTGAKRLYRLIMGRPFRGKVKVTSGNRYTYIRRGVLHVNPNERREPGWHGIVHGLSHHFHRRLHPGHKPHDGRGTHAFIERTMIEHVVNSGWLDGKLKRPDKAKTDVTALRHQRVRDRLTAWEAKLRRAENAIRKLRRQLAYYDRQANLPTS